MAKTPKAIKADDVAKLIKQVERLNTRVNQNGEPWETVGYCRTDIGILLKQLKGEYPII